MNDEFDALVQNRTWELVPSTSMQNLVGYFQSRILVSCPTFSALRFLPLRLVCCLLKGTTFLIFLPGQKCLVQNLLLHHFACIVYLGRHPISWSSKKWHTVARSSTELEYRSVAATTSKINWICSILIELGVTLPTPLVIYCDNVGATYLF
ncbi:hypothetical protein AAG906_020126 [Vitis piasezkii]